MNPMVWGDDPMEPLGRTEDDDTKPGAMTPMRSDPAHDAALADATARNCCMNPEWRGHSCEYHQGFEDGYDAAIEAATKDGGDDTDV